MKKTYRQKLLWEMLQKAHSNQKRKYTGEPYTNHLESVYTITGQYINHPLLWECCVCHDVIEDTSVTGDLLFDLLFQYGYSPNEASFIRNITVELTDEFTTEMYPKMNRQFRKQLEALRLAGISAFAQTIKYGDIEHNVESIAKYDKGFARVYLEEKRKVLEVMNRGDKDLYFNVIHTLITWLRKINE